MAFAGKSVSGHPIWLDKWCSLALGLFNMDLPSLNDASNDEKDNLLPQVRSSVSLKKVVPDMYWSGFFFRTVFFGFFIPQILRFRGCDDNHKQIDKTAKLNSFTVGLTYIIFWIESVYFSLSRDTQQQQTKLAL